jgi:hypothetical protein
VQFGHKDIVSLNTMYNITILEFLPGVILMVTDSQITSTGCAGCQIPNDMGHAT